MRLVPKNWAVFQHYKDRSPPWIKFHRSLLNDRAFMCLPMASKALAPLLWLLASETKEGEFDASIEQLTFRLHLSAAEVSAGLKPLIDKGFFVVASGVLAERLHGAIPETEAERETEKSYEPNGSLSAAVLTDPPDDRFPPCPHQKIIALYAKHLPGLSQPRIWEGARRQAMKARWVACAKANSFSDGYDDEEGGLRFWDSFFQHVATGTKLAKGFETNGRCWRPDLEWIMNASNFAKIVDGKYDL